MRELLQAGRTLLRAPAFTATAVFASLPSESIARQRRGARVTATQVLGFAAAGLLLALGFHCWRAYTPAWRASRVNPIIAVTD